MNRDAALVKVACWMKSISGSFQDYLGIGTILRKGIFQNDVLALLLAALLAR